MGPKNEKNFLILKIIEFELGATSCHNREQNTCHWNSMYDEAPLRLNQNMMKVLSCTFYKSLEPFNILNVKRCSETVFQILDVNKGDIFQIRFFQSDEKI